MRLSLRLVNTGAKLILIKGLAFTTDKQK